MSLALGPPGALPQARLPSLLFGCTLSAQGWKLPSGGTQSRKDARRPCCPAPVLTGSICHPGADLGARTGDSPRTEVSHLEASTVRR